jgi:hypothetical protein
MPYANMGRGGLVDSIFIRDIAMQKIVREAVLFDTYYQDVPAGAARKTEIPTDKTPYSDVFASAGSIARALPPPSPSRVFHTCLSPISRSTA